MLELAGAIKFLSRQVDSLKTAGEKKDEKAEEDGKATSALKPEPEFQALTDLCQALLSANEFLYVD